MTPSTGTWFDPGWLIGDMAPGAIETVEVVLTVDASAALGAEIETTATVSMFETDTDPGSDSATETTTVDRKIDIGLSKSDSADPVTAGSGAGNLVYTVTATNNGPSNATGVKIGDVLTTPTGVAVDSVVPSSGTFADPNWNLALDAGASATLTVTLTVADTAEDGAVVSNTATLVSTNETDTNAANNAASETTTIANEAPVGSPDVVSVEPARLLDTRLTGETVDDRFEKVGKVAAGGMIELDILGRGGVPDSGVGAVVLNVTMIRPDGNGFVTVHPCGLRPLASSMNAPAGGGVVANEVIAKLSASGTVCLYSSTPTNLAADLTGYIPATSGVVSLEPARLLDTRLTGETVDDRFEKVGKVAAGGMIELDILGRGGVPDSGVGAVVLNVTMIRPDGNGFVTVHPCGLRPLASSMNAPAGGGVVANEVIAKLSASGTVCLYSSTPTNLAADLTGYIPATSGVVSLEPARLLDTRLTGETVDDRFEKVGKVAAGGMIELDILGRGGVPDSGVGAVVLNVTMIRPDGNGFVTVHPCGLRPLASSMNAPAGGGVVANEVIAKLSASGTVCLYSSTPTNLAADLTGYIAT